MKNKFSDKELEKEKQTSFLEAAGFVIKLTFEKSDHTFFKRRLIEEIGRVWGGSGFLSELKRKWNFEIRFVSDPGRFEIISKEKKDYYLTLKREIEKKRVNVFYLGGLRVFDIVLRETFNLLLKKDGFILHAASIQRKDESVDVFLAPSGGGKTTVAKALSGARRRRFSDDMLIVKKRRKSWELFSPPFIEKDLLPAKREARKARFFFVKKAKRIAKTEIQDKSKILRMLLSQIWLSKEKIDEKVLKRVMAFVSESTFYELNATLNARSIWRILNEG